MSMPGARFTVALIVAASACLLLLPGLAHAQAIGGTVSDSTGAVLPGVTVEARSPALIEQVRTAVTDGNGQYLIVALETGVYSVTFTLPGFSTVVRDAVELSGGFTANIDVELPVGALEETVIVTQASPEIDVQSVEQRETIDRDIYEALPTARSYDSMALLVPALNIQGGPTTSLSADTGGLTGGGNNRMSIHGSRDADSVVELDGMDINQVAFEGAPAGSPFDAPIEEFVYDYSGSSAEVETGGVRLNLIPKEGSNAFSGGFHADLSHSAWLANNIDQKLIDRGIAGGKDGGTGMDQNWRVAPSVGGPIARDRLWFFTTYSFRRASLLPAGLFLNQDTSAGSYLPNLDERAIDRSDNWEGSLRLTWQASGKDKVQAFFRNYISNRLPNLSGSALDPIWIAPEAGSETAGSVNSYQLSWVRPQTNRILFEVAVGLQPFGTDLYALDAETQAARGRDNVFDARTDLHGSYEATTSTMIRNMGFFFGGTDVHFSTTNTTVRGSMSYVTGSHNLKVGVQLNEKWQNESYRSGNNWTNQITFRGRPVQARFHARPNETNELTNLGIYAQDQWTIDRLTLNLGVRFDYFKGAYPEQTTEAMTWAPTPRTFPGATVASWKDIQPRLGVVYDLRGDGRTALKASASRYGERNAIALAGEVNPVANNVLMSRTWLDGLVCLNPAVCVRGDGRVQGNPLLPYPNGEILSFNPNPGFASPAVTDTFDPDYAFGWGKKQANWAFSGSLQHEVRPGVTVDVGYFRRAYLNLSAVDDESNSPEDWDEWVFMVPVDERLPNGGGYPLTLVDLNPAALGVPQNVTRSADVFGGRSESWHGVDLNFSARFEDVLFQGGFATGKRTVDNCAVNAALPERINEGAGGLTGGGDSVVPVEHCANETPWIHQGSLFGSYTFPYDIVLSGTFFSRAGTPRLAVIPVPNAVAEAALGRPPTETSIAVNVITPGSAYGDRLNQVDLRLAKIISMAGAANLRASFDLYNVFNANAVSRERYTLRNYLQPVGVQVGRMVKLSFQFNF